MRRFVPVYVLPVLFLLVWVLLPVIRGTETFLLRDVFHAHLPMKWAQAQAMLQGYLPLIDPYRAGGQPLLGNPNAVPLYPDNLLYLVAPFFWAFNAHFWLHLLLAPFAMYWLARVWGLDRPGAWAAGVCYVASGYFLSNMSFYNLIAGVSLVPALVAACLEVAGGSPRRWLLLGVGLLWALLLLAGEPLVALLAFLLAASALLARHGRRIPRLPRLAVAFLLGTLVAAPHLVEFLRILPLSFRGHYGYRGEVGTVASWDPRSILEWFLPFAFGRPDRIDLGSFWGERFFTDRPPLYFSLYPGILALALVAAAGWARRPLAWWAWGAAAGGIFFSLGRFNLLVQWLFQIPGMEILRYPVKFWLPVAVGGALLCGLGFQRALGQGEVGARRRLVWTLLALGLLLGTLLLTFTLFPQGAEGLLRRLIPEGFGPQFVANERRRWLGLALFSVGVVLLLGFLVRLARRPRSLAPPALLVAHTATQLFFLHPLLVTDAVLPYRVPPPLLDSLPEDALVAHGGFHNLFGSAKLGEGRYPQGRITWLHRRTFYELYPAAGTLWGRRYELNLSPEGLDSFLTRMAEGAVKHSEDLQRIRLLRAWGVHYLVLDRKVDRAAAGEVRLVNELPSFGQKIYLYQMRNPAPQVLWAGYIWRAPNMNAAYEVLTHSTFDPRQMVVLPGEGRGERGKGGKIQLLRRGPEGLEVHVSSPVPGILVIQRAYLPIYRATVDGRKARLVVANLHRLGVEVPAGEHHVQIWIDRRPLAFSFLMALLALLGLFWLSWRLKDVEVKGSAQDIGGAVPP